MWKVYEFSVRVLEEFVFFWKETKRIGESREEKIQEASGWVKVGQKTSWSLRIHEKERIVKPIIFLLFPASYLLLINLCPLLIGKTKRRGAPASTELRLLESRLC